MKTGFRAHLGGYQAIAGVTPDLAAFGKAVANGWTLAGLAGRADVMDVLGEGGVTADSNGTFNAPPYALAAGFATFEILRDGGIERLYELGERMRSGLTEAITATGVEACVTGIDRSGRSTSGRSHRATTARPPGITTTPAAKAYLAAMLDQGVLEPPLVIGDRRLSLAHTEDDIDRTIEAAANAFALIA